MKEYCFVPNLDDPTLLSVRLMEGRYTGSVFSLLKVQWTMDEQGPHLTTRIRVECIAVNGKRPIPFFRRVNQEAFDKDVAEVVEHVLKTMQDSFGENDLKIPEDSDV